MQRRSGRLLAAAAVLALVADQVSKAAIRSNFALGDSVPLIKGVINLTYVRNVGAAFGLFPGRLAVFIVIALGVIAGVAWVWWRLRPTSAWVTVALGLVAGGAAGNLIDRVVAGRVTDFFDLGWFPVFNVADMALDIGVAILLVWMLFSDDDALTGPVDEDIGTGPEALS